MKSKTANNKMQRTSHGSNGGSPLILAFGGRLSNCQCNLG
jgi:hypothetical protein